MTANPVTHADQMSVEEGLRLYGQMVLIRVFEERCGSLMNNGQLAGFLHLSIGQEAVAVGVCSALRTTDTITSTHRGHGHCIAKGGDVGRMMAEIFGNRQGYCLGRSGSMHVSDPAVGILGANAIVGAGIPIAVGAALTSQVLKTGAVSVAFFGEVHVPRACSTRVSTSRDSGRSPWCSSVRTTCSLR